MLYSIARELAKAGKNVCVTTTTKMYLPTLEHSEQEQGCPDAVLINADYNAAVEGLQIHFDAGESGKVVFLASTLLEGEADSRTKVKGIPEDWAGRLLSEGICDAVIVEADGARHLPFKAPAHNEPCIPAETSIVIAVAGVDALGSVLNEENVCRASMVAMVTGHDQGDQVDAAMIARYMSRICRMSRRKKHHFGGP